MNKVLYFMYGFIVTFGLILLGIIATFSIFYHKNPKKKHCCTRIQNKVNFIFFSAALTSLPHVLWLERKRLILNGWIKAHFPLNICTLRLPLVHKAPYFWLLHTIESLKIFQRNKNKEECSNIQIMNDLFTWY